MERLDTRLTESVPRSMLYNLGQTRADHVLTGVRTMKFRPYNDNTFSPSGNRIIRIRLDGGPVLADLLNGRLKAKYTIVGACANGARANLRLFEITHPFQKVVVRSNGALLTETDEYIDLVTLLTNALPQKYRDGHWQENLNSTGYDDTVNHPTTGLTGAPGAGNNYTGVRAKDVSANILDSIFQSDKLIPLDHMKLEIELHLPSRASLMAKEDRAAAPNDSTSADDLQVILTEVEYVCECYSPSQQYADSMRRKIEKDGLALKFSAHYGSVFNVSGSSTSIEIPFRARHITNLMFSHRLPAEFGASSNNEYISHTSGDNAGVDVRDIDLRVGKVHMETVEGVNELYTEYLKMMGMLMDINSLPEISKVQYFGSSSEKFASGYKLDLSEHTSGVSSMDGFPILSVSYNGTLGSAVRLFAFLKYDGLVVVKPRRSVVVLE